MLACFPPSRRARALAEPLGRGTAGRAPHRNRRPLRPFLVRAESHSRESARAFRDRRAPLLPVHAGQLPIRRPARGVLLRQHWGAASARAQFRRALRLAASRASRRARLPAAHQCSPTRRGSDSARNAESSNEVSFAVLQAFFFPRFRERMPHFQLGKGCADDFHAATISSRTSFRRRNSCSSIFSSASGSKSYHSGGISL